MNWAYLAALAVSLGGLAVLDRRFSLALWNRPGVTALTVAVSVAVFVVWDVLGIALGIFFRGTGEVQTGLVVGPEFPVEELIFLTLLNYLAILLYAAWNRRERSVK